MEEEEDRGLHYRKAWWLVSAQKREAVALLQAMMVDSSNEDTRSRVAKFINSDLGVRLERINRVHGKTLRRLGDV
jgi:hypothetical protein